MFAGLRGLAWFRLQDERRLSSEFIDGSGREASTFTAQAIDGGPAAGGGGAVGARRCGVARRRRRGRPGGTWSACAPRRRRCGS